VSQPPTCVIYNPAAGRGRARDLVNQVRTWAAPGAEMRETSAPGHGVELARAAADEGFERVIAAGGDGTVNEVANGLMRADRRATMGVWPLGSSNDYAFALGLDDWFRAEGKGVPLRPRAADVGVVSGGRREHFYLNCAGVGFNGMVALDSRKIRWLRGMPLYALAYLRCLLWHFRAPPAVVEWGDGVGHPTPSGELRSPGDPSPTGRGGGRGVSPQVQPPPPLPAGEGSARREAGGPGVGMSTKWMSLTSPLLALTVNVGVREGGFPITPAARVDDGRFDFVHVADLRRWDLIRLLPALMAGKIPADEPKIRTGTAARVRVTSGVPLCCHADGEFACVPADGVTELTFDTLPGRVTVEGA